MAAMLDEELAPDSGIGLAPAPIAVAPTGMGGARAATPVYAEGMMVGPAAMPYEAPFGTGWVVGLAICFFLLVLSGIMSFDLVRNMWSWNAPYSVNSSIIEMIRGFLP
jgi:hypothetical protein